MILLPLLFMNCNDKLNARDPNACLLRYKFKIHKMKAITAYFLLHPVGRAK